MVGRTERAILAETLKLNDVSDVSDALISSFYSALGVAAHALEGKLRASGMALPGAREAVSAFSTSEVVQSLVTGNIQSIAKVKLEAFELCGGSLDLEIGGYGDDGSDRAELVRLARERAEAKYGITFPGKRTFVIGDTPLDVKGAHDAGAFAVGVATGSSSVDVLEGAGAELVIADLTHIRPLRSAILGSFAG
jgi:phosphoglycolate phosphatase-like HAD superfamily hydrolase